MQKLRLRKKAKLSKQTPRTSRWIYTVCQNFFQVCRVETVNRELATTQWDWMFIYVTLLNRKFHASKRGSYMVWEINMGVCPRLEFDNIMFINCLGYVFYIYGAFEFLCNSIANL